MRKVDTDRTIWMTIKAKALDSGYYRRYIWKDTSKAKDSDFEFLPCQGLTDVSFLKVKNENIR